MRSRSSMIAVIGLLPAALPLAAQTDYIAPLDGAQAGTASPAVGSASLTLTAAEDALTYAITLAGLDLDGNQTPGDPNDNVTAMHFHLAPAGMNGGIVFGLISPNHDTDDLVIDPVAGTLSGIWDADDPTQTGLTLADYLADLNAGNLYLNVHTPAFPGGAIRGQVLPVIFADGFESGDTSRWGG
jgi:CHRD domain